MRSVPIHLVPVLLVALILSGAFSQLLVVCGGHDESPTAHLELAHAPGDCETPPTSCPADERDPDHERDHEHPPCDDAPLDAPQTRADPAPSVDLPAPMLCLAAAWCPLDALAHNEPHATGHHADPPPPRPPQCGPDAGTRLNV